MNQAISQLFRTSLSDFKMASCFVWLITAGMLLHMAFLSNANAGTQFVYFGTYTGANSKGIYVAHFEPQTGELSAPELVAETPNPTFLAVDPKRHCLYVVNEIADFGHGNSGAVSAFSLDDKTGHLVLLNQEPSGGAGPCHLAVAQSGKCVLVANYGSGSVAALPVQADGRLGAPSSSIQHHGSSINRQRQEGPHAHFVTWDPPGRIVLACDLGLDKVLLYQMDVAQLKLLPSESPSFEVKPGSGPRHLAFAPNGRYVYILNEISSTLTACSYDASQGELKEIQTVSTLPQDFKGANTCAEVAVHPNGRFVYASNRGNDSISVFAINAATGRVNLIQQESTQGKTPRHFAVDPTGRWLLAENQDSNNVVVFALDNQTGRLTSAGVSQKLGAPVCAVFVPKR